jgi:hypothetical protein
MEDAYRIGLKKGIREIHFKMDDLNFTTKNADIRIDQAYVKTLICNFAKVYSYDNNKDFT